MSIKRNIYLIKFKEFDWDEYDSFVVISFNKKNCKEYVFKIYSKDVYSNGNLTEENIKSIKKIGESDLKQQIVLGSFNAG